MRNFEFTKQQMRKVHGLREDSTASEIDAARAVYHARTVQRLEGMFADQAARNRQDAGETAIIAQELEYASAKLVETVYPEFLAEQLIPRDNESPDPGDEFWSYKMWDKVGMASYISDYTTELPNVGAFATKHTGRCISMGNKFHWDLQELRAAAKSGNRLPVQKMNAAKRANMQLRDDLFAFGDPETGLNGILNNANIPVVSSGITGAWASATPQQMLADLRIVERYGPINSHNAFKYDTLILPTAEYQLAAGTELSTDNNTTVLEQFERTSRYIKTVVEWHRLDVANAAGTGPRAMFLKRDPETMTLVNVIEFEMLPAQAKGLLWETNCHSRAAGTKVIRPLAAAYVDLD